LRRRGISGAITLKEKNYSFSKWEKELARRRRSKIDHSRRGIEKITRRQRRKGTKVRKGKRDFKKEPPDVYNCGRMGSESQRKRKWRREICFAAPRQWNYHGREAYSARK